MINVDDIEVWVVELGGLQRVLAHVLQPHTSAHCNKRPTEGQTEVCGRERPTKGKKRCAAARGS